MSRLAWTIAVPAAAMAAGVGAYWLWQHGMAIPGTSVVAKNPSGPVIYFQDPDGKPAYSAEPQVTADGRPYRAVLASEDVSFETQPRTADQAGKRILYYRNPMGMPDVSKTPKKDSMGMDYIPVYEDEEEDSVGIKISLGKIQRSGVQSELAQMRPLSELVRSPGTIQLDERKIAVITLRTEAFIERVENVTTGSEVKEGQPLMYLYSPAIAAAAAEYVSALGFRPGGESPRGARQRLMNYAVPETFLAELESTRKVPLTFAWTAPRDGVVLERNAVDGMRANPGDTLFRIADHRVVWALVDVTERDLGAVKEGQSVTIRVRSYPDKAFSGKVALVYPHMNPATRTVRVRIELPNDSLLLRPDMYADAEIDTGGDSPVLAVPDSAIIDSGDRQIVIVDKSDGRFEPRAVKLGRHGAGYTEIREGLQENETVVTSANFLIDAESNLKAALKTMTDTGARP
jgi:membrane fusion protein, copper/silver efflux system